MSPGLAHPTSYEKTSEAGNPSQQVNPTVERGIPARRVDPGWLLLSFKRLIWRYGMTLKGG